MSATSRPYSRASSIGVALLLLLGASPVDAQRGTGPADTRTPVDPNREIVAAATSLLRAYARKDITEVMTHVDPERITMFGTDSAEVIRGATQFVRQMRQDFALWDSSRFEPLRHVTIERSGQLATAFFEAPWTAYRGVSASRYLLRFATAWRKDANGHWRLVQTMNAVATTGTSAAELRKPGSQ